jgi:hypothetical protein
LRLLTITDVSGIAVNVEENDVEEEEEKEEEEDDGTEST